LLGEPAYAPLSANSWRRTFDGSFAISVDYWDNPGALLATPLPTTRGRLTEWSYVRAQSARELLSSAAVVEGLARDAQALLEVGDGSGAAAALRGARGIRGYGRSASLIQLWRQIAQLGDRKLNDAWLEHTFTGHSADVT
jgi:hypothetical protein